MSQMIKDVSQNSPFGKTLRVFEVPPALVDEAHAVGRIEIPDEMDVYPNQPLVLKAGQQSALTVVDKEAQYIIKADREISFFGIRGRNKEQVLLQHILTDPEIRCIVVTGPPGTGKAQPMYSKVLTNTGWVRMEDIKEGTMVATPDGSFAPVLGVYPQGKKDVYRVHFNDGSSTDCCKEHLWKAQKRWERVEGKPGSVRELQDIMGNLHSSDGRNRYYIPMTEPIDFPERNLPLQPYLMGVLLGDGSFSVGVPTISSKDSFVIERCEKLLASNNCKLSRRSEYDYDIIRDGDFKSTRCTLYRFEAENLKSGVTEKFEDIHAVFAAGYSKHAHKAAKSGKPYGGKIWKRYKKDEKSVNPVKDALMALGLYGNRSEDKFIPEEYLLGSVEQRIDLLQGIMDADGTVDARNGRHVSLSTTSENIIDGLTQLVQSLGGTTSVTSRTPSYTYGGEDREGMKAYNITVRLPPHINPFKLPRKAELVVPKSSYLPARTIEKVEHLGEEEVQCILIDHPEHLYITDDYIVTHNTLLVGSYALDQVLDQKKYEKLILSKPLEIVTRSRYWGTTPGAEQEKFAPFLRSFTITFEDLVGKNGSSYISTMVSNGVIDFMPLELARGTSLKKSIVYYDEAQNLNYHELETLGTRIDDVGKSKLILTGDLNQRDKRIQKKRTGLWKLVNSPFFLNSPFTAHVHLTHIERGEIAEMFFRVFDEDRED